jgi:hypothetical protein
MGFPVPGTGFAVIQRMIAMIHATAINTKISGA